MIRLRGIRINSTQSIAKSTFTPTIIIPKCQSTVVDIRWASQRTEPNKKPFIKREKSFKEPSFPTSVTPNEIKRLKIRALETAIETHSQKGRWHLIMQLYAYVLREGYAPQKLPTYHTLLIACKHLKYVDKIPTILESIEQGNLKMTIVTYQLLLEAFEASSVSADVIDQVWDQINALHLKPSPAMYISTVNSYLSANDYKKAITYFEELFEKSPFSTASLFVSFLKYWAARGNLDNMKSFFERYKAQGFPPDATPYNCFMEHYAKMVDTNSLVQTWNSMKEEFITPTKESYLHMISGFVNKGDMQQAQHYFHQMSTKLKPEIEAYNILAKGYIKAKNRTRVEELMKEAKDSGQQYNKETYEMLIDMYSQLSEKRPMLQTSHDMIVAGFVPSKPTYAAIIRTTAFHKDYEMMEAYYEDMRRRKVIPSEYIYRVILKTWAVKRDFINFLRYLRKMNIEDQIVPSPKTMEYISLFLEHESAGAVPFQTLQLLETEPETNVPEAEVVTEGEREEPMLEEEVLKVVAEIDETAHRNAKK